MLDRSRRHHATGARWYRRKDRAFMARLIRRFLLFQVLFATLAAAQTIYFPDKAFSDDSRLDKFTRDWYSGQLKALEEPSLRARSKDTSLQSYRFVWLRTFHHPIAIRVDVRKDGTSIVTTKVASGAGGYRPGKLVEHKTAALTLEQTQDLVAKISLEGFWGLSAYLAEGGGCDGSEWIIEGSKDGKYHVVTRWSPTNGLIYELGIAFIGLAHLSIPSKEMY